MQRDQLQQVLQYAFFTDMHWIVFWYDAPGHFADALLELSLDGVQILNMARESTLGVKMSLELGEPEAPTLLYFPHAELASEEDWLLDSIRRYNESALAEMRTDYVIPLTTKLASYEEKLEQDKDASTSAAVKPKASRKS
ncbi:hypothetical protein ACIGG6_18165 [Vreelandella lionensis]|uniref:Uncharacterized protein n=1 Tax=Vreelandella lionensis TaxID=1144478 RepID=A0ABW8C0A4_9GAMM